MSRERGRRLTSRDVARQAGVSQATVSNVLNHPHLVAPATLARVRAAMDELGFVVDSGARRLRAGRSATLAVSVLDTGNPFWGEVVRGVTDFAATCGYVVVLGSTSESPQREAEHLRVFREQRAAGLLAAPVDPDLSGLARAAAEGLPVVLLDYQDPAGRLPFVGVDDVRGAELAVDHLLELGHRRIAFLNGPHRIGWCVDRLAGARRAASARGLDVVGTVLEVPVDALTASEGDRAMSEHVLRRSDVTAVLCVNDMVALGALRALHRGGVRVPADMSVVGYDDTAFAEMLQPSLTTVRQEPYRIGREAARLVVQAIEEPDAAPGRNRVFAPELVVRESTAPPLSRT
ncbi:LacI family transcriptional regulator [Longimycelium tulufanense]|uniref:LacI family transcriptional regulator n=1 Tax=Longimycelium tulufanense TaxID=907463 RepID=A0A8J3CAV4_9PSEU|nr:LacI family DNA-binding transcriptional regulator [Longimycelium tulufanense]GGM40548.1 LacI family transcriptional regulator [Longimycelium tulufanense]